MSIEVISCGSRVTPRTVPVRVLTCSTAMKGSASEHQRQRFRAPKALLQSTKGTALEQEQPALPCGLTSTRPLTCGVSRTVT